VVGDDGLHEGLVGREEDEEDRQRRQPVAAFEQQGRWGRLGFDGRWRGERRHGVTAPALPAASPARAGSSGVGGALYRVSISPMAGAAPAAQSASPGPCAMATVADSPARSLGQRSSRSIWIRTGTRWTTRVNSPETTLRGISANWAPVDLLIQTTRPWNGSRK